ncbi:hypothetical protein [Vibrio jasicida]|uniref:hypothetical protein n=1 Tax=Vibrio jasicida TaxID=766224 RepID=UPI0009E5002D|nr:hypothetical protein [Vibrio jasicida]
MNLEQVLQLVKVERLIEEIEDKINRVVETELLLNELINKDVDLDNVDSIISCLSQEFLDTLPIIISKVSSEETLIPSEIPVVIQKKKYRVKGEVWVVHKNDVDPFPSSPHAHNYDQNLVMHLGNGDLYRKRDFIATAKKKQFLALRKQINNVDLPPLEIEP